MSFHSSIRVNRSSFTSTKSQARSPFAPRPFGANPDLAEESVTEPDNSSIQSKPLFTPRNFLTVPLFDPSVAQIQAKLTIGQPNDPYEQEADRVAAQVVNQISAPPPSPIQREDMQKEETLQAKPLADSIAPQVQRADNLEEEDLQMMPVQRVAEIGGTEASPDLESSIAQARGGGQPLNQSIRAPIEQAMGADFSGVKVHTDAQADQLNRSVQARAFTTRQDVFFRQGEYNPGSRGGQELIAHELTHVVQQGVRAGQRSLAIQRKPELVDGLQYEDSDHRGLVLTKQVKESEDIGGQVFLAHGLITNKMMVFYEDGLYREYEGEQNIWTPKFTNEAEAQQESYKSNDSESIVLISDIAYNGIGNMQEDKLKSLRLGVKGGILPAIDVKKTGATPPYELVNGRNRIEVSKEVGYKKIPIRIVT